MTVRDAEPVRCAVEVWPSVAVVADDGGNAFITECVAQQEACCQTFVASLRIAKLSMTLFDEAGGQMGGEKRTEFVRVAPENACRAPSEFMEGARRHIGRIHVFSVCA